MTHSVSQCQRSPRASVNKIANASAGTAYVEGLDIRQDMAAVYSLMGVCPQVWPTFPAA